MKERQHTPHDPLYLSGKEAGRKWGREKATPAELENAQRLFERVSQDPAYDWDWYFFENSQSHYSIAEQLAVDLTGVDPEEVDVKSEAESFWEDVFGQNLNNENLKSGVYLQGFADGALEVWDERRDRVI